MEKKEMKLLSTKCIIVVYAVFAALMLCGTFFDMQISDALFNKKNPIAVFVSYWGLYPIVPCAFVALSIFIKLIVTDKKDWSSYIGLALSGYLVYESIKQFNKLFKSAEPAVKYLCLSIGILLAVLLAVFVFYKVDITNRTKVKSVGYIILLTAALQFLLINKVIKTPWGRPRYRSVIAVAGMNYQPWYAAGLSQSAKDMIAAGFVAADEFKSFPSGHGGCAATLMTLATLSAIVPCLKKQEWLIAGVGIAWSVLTILGRIMAGAHFLTDVVFGTMITFTLFVCVAKITFAITNRKKKQ